MTALVSLSVGGAITGFSFVPKAAADISSPTSMPLNLVALRQSVRAAQPDRAAPSHDAMLRAAIVHVADYYLTMAQSKTPAEMEAIIWQHDSLDGADHGESCAAFASLTLELGAQVVGRQSWVSGGGSYPWPLHSWADVRVEENPASPRIISIQQDAEAQHRWHPLGDGYRPLPGDWVLFDGHVEVVTQDTGGVLHTVGGDSLPNFSVNAHEYPEPLSAAGVVGFVDNGVLPGDPQAAGGQAHGRGRPAGHSPGSGGKAAQAPRQHPGAGHGSSGTPDEPAAIPGAVPAPAARAATEPAIPGLVPAQRTGSADNGPAGNAAAAPAVQAGREREKTPAAGEQLPLGGTAIPGITTDALAGKHGGTYRRHHPSPVRTAVAETQAQQAFISEVAPGAVAAQRRYGVPAAVTIAQAIDESGWGQSELAAQDHNLFGIKGTGPAGSVPLPTQEDVNGQPVSTSASFRVYHNVAESIEDHGRLLAQSGYYQQAMAERQHPDKFAAALTGVYATNPDYGANLISLMRRYDLYRYGPAGHGQPGPRAAAAEPGGATIPGVPATAPATPAGTASTPPARPRPAPSATGTPAPAATPTAGRTGTPAPAPTAGRTGTPAPAPTAGRTGTPAPNPTASPTGTQSPAPMASPTGTRSPGSTAVPARTGTAGSPRTTRTGTPTPAGAPDPARAASPQPDRTGTTHSAGSGSARPAPVVAPSSPAPSRSGPPARSPAPGTPGASIPGLSTPQSSSAQASTPQSSRAQSSRAQSSRAQASIPGVSTQSESARRLTRAQAAPRAAATPRAPATPRAAAAPRAAATRHASATPRSAAPARATLLSARRYQPHMPRSVLNSFVESAKAPLLAQETTYRDVASFRGISWQLLAACDWMQCDARPRRSPVYGERLGTVNADGTVYTQRSAALARCADDLVRLAGTVYGIDLTRGRDLSVRDLANAFAAFRWGGLLKAHDCSALEFPYAVAGLTEHHLGMRWPRITAPGTGDRPGSRFRRPFGAVPIVLGLEYPATV